MRTDDKIKAEVIAALSNFAPLYATKPQIAVEVVNGAVTLNGVVRGGGQRGMAERLAATIEGVTTVHNYLLDDPTIEGAIARALAANPKTQISTTTVGIKLYNGMVTLQGPVSSEIKKLTAEEVTRTIPGVIKVVNGLTVISIGKSQIAI